MQVQFTRDLKTQQGMFKSKQVWELTILVQPTAEEDQLMSKWNLWEWDAQVEMWAPDDKTIRPRLPFSRMKQGLSFTSQRGQSIIEAEVEIVKELKEALETAHANETFNGTRRVVEF